MAGANCVVAVGFQNLDTPLFRARDAGGAERAIVVVDASALELDRLAVDAQALGCIDFYLANAHLESCCVDWLVVGFDQNLGAIEMRIGRRPEARVRNMQRTGCGGATGCRNREWR